MQRELPTRLLAAAVLAVVLLVPALFVSGVGSTATPTQPVPRRAGVVAASALPTTPQLLGSVARQDVGLVASSVSTTWRIVLAEDANGFGYDIGNNPGHPNGDTATYTFTGANDQDFSNVTALLTNGIDNPIEFVSVDKAGGPASFSVANESLFFGTSPDFQGNAIDSIKLVVHDLQITLNGTGAVEFANYTWQVWGHPIFIAFAPPSDADGTYLFDRNYTNVSVSLASDGTAVTLDWDGVNRSMQGAGRLWHLNVTDIPNGLHGYRVWANDSLNEVFQSEVRHLTVAFRFWSIQKFGAGSGPGLATDSTGRTHMCWEDSTGNAFYATNTSSGWSIQKIGFGGAGFCSIALDHEGRPNVVFGTLKYGLLVGSTWTIETITSVTPTKGADIAINPVTDQPVVAFYDSLPAEHYLVLENRTGPGTWVASIVDRNGDTGWMPSVAVNSTGIAHVAYTDASGDLWYATVSAGHWDPNLVTRGPVLPGLGRISLALNSSGIPHIAYAGGGPRYGTVGYIGLHYANLSGTTWEDQEIYPGPIQAVSLALDAQDHPHVAFSLVGTPPPSGGVLRDLRYLAWNGSWTAAVLSHSVNSTGVALALSPAGVPEIALTTWCCGGGPNQGILEYMTVTIGLFATFEVTPSMGTAATVFTFDPRASFDTYFAFSALQARWDFNGDGIWDTGWAVPAVVQHTYSSDGQFTAHVQVKDPNAVMSEAQEPVTVDSVPPVTTAALAGTLGTSGWYVSSLNITLTAADDLTAVTSTSYRLDGGAWTPYLAPIEVSSSGNHTIDYYSVDAVGNTESAHTLPFHIDTGLPTTTAVITGTSGASGWYVSAVQVTLGASDPMSGIASTSYRVDGGSWQTYAAPFSLGDGAHSIQYYSRDVAGNQGATGTSTVQVDTTAPTVALQISGAQSANGWYRAAVGLNLTASDALSGVASLSVTTDGSTWQTFTSGKYSAPFGLDGFYNVTYYATDRAGNAGSHQTVSLKIDQTAPVATIHIAGTAGTNGWFISNATVSLSSTDATSGVSQVSYRVDGGATQTYSNAFLIGDGSHTVDYWSTDVAGNVQTTQSMTVKVDTGAPTLSGLSPSGALVSSAVVVSWAGSDSGSGIAEYQVRVDGGAFQSVGTSMSTTVTLADGDHTIAVRAVDAAGNSAELQTHVHVDANPFSFSGPFLGMPTVALLAVAVIAAATLFLLYRRRKSRKTPPS